MSDTKKTPFKMGEDKSKDHLAVKGSFSFVERKGISNADKKEKQPAQIQQQETKKKN